MSFVDQTSLLGWKVEIKCLSIYLSIRYFLIALRNFSIWHSPPFSLLRQFFGVHTTAFSRFSACYSRRQEAWGRGGGQRRRWVITQLHDRFRAADLRGSTGAAEEGQSRRRKTASNVNDCQSTGSCQTARRRPSPDANPFRDGAVPDLQKHFHAARGSGGERLKKLCRHLGTFGKMFQCKFRRRFERTI